MMIYEIMIYHKRLVNTVKFLSTNQIERAQLKYLYNVMINIFFIFMAIWGFIVGRNNLKINQILRKLQQLILKLKNWF